MKLISAKQIIRKRMVCCVGFDAGPKVKLLNNDYQMVFLLGRVVFVSVCLMSFHVVGEFVFVRNIQPSADSKATKIVTMKLYRMNFAKHICLFAMGK